MPGRLALKYASPEATLSSNLALDPRVSANGYCADSDDANREIQQKTGLPSDIRIIFSQLLFVLLREAAVLAL